MKRYLIAGVLAAVLAGCSGAGSTDPPVPAAASGPVETLYVVGSGTSVGTELADPLREAWPRILYGEAFPRSAILVNGAAGPSTAARAVAEQLPLARELHPEFIAVWLGSYDLNQVTAVDEFGERLRALLGGLRATGPRRLLIANLPRLPAYEEPMRLAYNRAIAAAASAGGADLVDIADLTLDPVSGDADYQPDADGHRQIADAFASTLKNE
jgi:lysophospholipase L1-like esterase